MEAHVCNHPKVPHGVEYLLSGQKSDGASVFRAFPDLEEADLFAQKIMRQTTGRLAWLKIYRSDNEAYVCFRWDNPKREEPERQKVKLEVDMEPLGSAFENIGIGFTEQGKSIRNLQIWQAVLAAGFVVDVLTHFFT